MDESGISQLPDMPSPVKARPQFRTGHFVGNASQVFEDDHSAIPDSSNATPIYGQPRTHENSLLEKGLYDDETRFSSSSLLNYSHSFRTPRADNLHQRVRSRLHDRVLNAVSHLSSVTDTIDSNISTPQIQSPFDSKRPKRLSSRNKGLLCIATKPHTVTIIEQPYSLTQQLESSSSVPNSTFWSSDESSIEERLMKGIIAVLQQSESDIVLPVHNRRQDQSAHGFSNKLAPTSLCTLFADVFKHAQTELSEDMTLAGKTRFEDMVRSIKRYKEFRATWLLLNDILHLHYTHPKKAPDVRPLVLSESDKFQRFLCLEHYDLAIEAAVVSWLEQTAAEDLEDYIGEVLYETDEVAWRHTLSFVLSEPRNGQNGEKRNDSLISSLDPDAPTRTGKGICQADAEEESVFLKRLFTLIRCGRTDMAIKLCQSCNQPWRAASLLAFQATTHTKSSPLLETTQDVKRHELLSLVCSAFVQDRTVSKYERGIYASMIGHVGTLMELAASWQDAIWSQLRCRTIINSSRFVQDLVATCTRNGTDGGIENEDIDDITSLSREDLFDVLENHDNEDIQQAAKSIHAKIQKNIILECIHEAHHLIEPFLQEYRLVVEKPHYIATYDETRSRLEKSSVAEKVAPYLMHFVHLVLVLRNLEQIPQDLHSKADEIIEGYVYDLIDRHMHTCIATYTAQLQRKDLQITLYAFYLAGITDTRLKHFCLQKAKEAQLPMSEISQAIVTRVRTHDEEQLHCDNLGINAVTISSNETVSAADWQIIDALEWLLQDETQKLSALIEANAILRKFIVVSALTIVTNKFSAARELLYNHVLPANVQQFDYQAISTNPTVQNALNEHASIRAYLDADEAYQNWHKHMFDLRPSKISPDRQGGRTSDSLYALKEEHEQRLYQNKLKIWEQRQLKFTEAAISKLENVIAMESWMENLAVEDTLEETKHDSRRIRQLSLLRYRCLPEVVVNLATVCLEMEQLHECILLSERIARNENGLLDVFRQSKNQLKKYLEIVRKASLNLLQRGDDQLGVSSS